MTSRPRLCAALALAAALALLPACAGLLPRSEPPQVTLLDLGVKEVTLFAQRYTLRLELRNPNAAELAITGVVCELLLNDRPFLSGVSAAAVAVPGYGRGEVEVEATGTLAGLLRQAAELEKGKSQTFRYRLRGHVGQALGGRLPFDQAGEVSLPASLLP
ncbi:MAG: LEA/WHy family protein [Deferrisomatales bacterium]